MALTILLRTTDGFVLLLSFFGNMYILIVNGWDWIKNKNLNLTDKLICGVGAFEALFELLKACGWVLEMMKVQADYMTSLVVNLAILSCNLWFSTYLCVTFCLTIVNCKHEFFKCLQRRSSKMITFLLILSIVASFLLILPLAHSISVIPISNTSLIIHNQTISEDLRLYGKSIHYFEAYIFASSLGFLMSSASLLTTIISLWRHVQRMKKNAQSFRSSNTDVHMRAVRTLFFTFLSHTIMFTNILLLLLKSTENAWVPYISILASLSNALSAINTIKGNSRLVKPLDKLSQCLPHGTP